MENTDLATLEYSVLVVTRNRSEALALSLPLILNQHRKPAQLVVVDSSDDPCPNESLIASLQKDQSIPIIYVESPAGMTLQRNLGLRHITHPIVLIPDDDSLLEPEVMTEVMAVYERDTSELIGGVCTAESLTTPKHLTQIAQNSYELSARDRFQKNIARILFHFERSVAVDPLLLAARRLIARLPKPYWLDEHDAIPVEWMTGFRMSYRTDFIRHYGFDEALGKYALGEDIDASLGALKSKLLVGVRSVGIYHHKSPERRDNGYSLGVMQSLNRAYILAKTGEVDTALKIRLVIFLLYKCCQYALTVNKKFGRDRLKGALLGLYHSLQLLNVPQEQLMESFIQTRKKLKLSD